MKMQSLDPLDVGLVGTRLIDASAGTGKTYTITILLLRLLLEEKRSLDQILVVTFTRAATTELRERVRLRLQQALELFSQQNDVAAGDEHEDSAVDPLLRKYYQRRSQQGQLDEDRRRLRVALRQIDDAAIQTIHGFCQRMLQENAFESGVDFDTELVSDLSPVLRELVHKFWAQRVYSLPDHVVRFLLESKSKAFGISFEVFIKLAQRVASLPDVPVLPVDFQAPSPDQPGLSEDELKFVFQGLQLDFIKFVRKELPRRQQALRQRSFDDLLLRLRDALREDKDGTLRQRIFERYPAALIDEFQDTDPVQYEIFRRLYHKQGHQQEHIQGHEQKASMFLIGDPKQAIYSFRGADVFAYMKAIGDAAENCYTLDTNYRSDRGLVDGINYLFERVRLPFLFAKIHFAPVAVHQQNPRLTWPQQAQNEQAAALEILFVKRDKKLMGQRGNFMPENKLKYFFPQMIAHQILAFLRSAAQIDGQAVQPGDIAVLCRTNKQLVQMQKALRDIGIPSVLQSQDGVFASAEAQDMLRIAWAMAEPERSARLKSALTTRSFGMRAQDLNALQNDVARWNDKVGQFHHWNETWKQQGFIQAFQRLFVEAKIEVQLLRFVDGERSLTNLLHLAELMQAQAGDAHLGPVALCHWLEQMCRGDGDLQQDKAQLRLESDAAAVQLVTIHRSKGMEYPVVYCPYLWDGGGLRKEDARWLKFHDRDDDDQLKLELGADKKSAHYKWAEFELMAENMRLLYVALTRAKHRCSIVWGGKNKADQSALGFLLHQVKANDALVDLEQVEDLRKRTVKHIKTLGDDKKMLADLQPLLLKASGRITIKEIGIVTDKDMYQPPALATRDLQHRVVEKAPRFGWRVASFSALTADVHSEQTAVPEGADHDALPDDKDLLSKQAADDDSKAETLVTLAASERGAAFGNYVHKIFELLDFQHEQKEIERLVFALATHMGHKKHDAQALVRALVQVLKTPLRADDKDFFLATLTTGQRLNELEFHLCAGLDTRAGAGLHEGAGLDDEVTAQASVGLTAAKLAELFSKHGGRASLRAYAERLRGLQFAPLRGYLKGYIDMAFTYRGRWYVLDYKTNFLGSRAKDYDQESLTAAMAEHHYYLQYHLYCLALHRYLRQRLDGYDYEHDFGGVLYLFVRGMHPNYPAENGVYFDKPSAQIIQGLDVMLGGAQGFSLQHKGADHA